MKNKPDIGQYLFDLFEKNWDKIFLINAINGSSYSYGDFFNKTMFYYNELKHLKLEKNDKLCLLMKNSIEFFEIMMACLLLEIVMIPIDTNKGFQTINNILSSIRFKVILSNVDSIKAQFNTANFNFTKDFETLPDTKNSLKLFHNPNYDSKFLITFTSGSTGIPKGVIHSFSNLFHSAKSFNEFFHFTQNNKFYHNFPMSYMAGILNSFILPMITGSKIIVDEQFVVSKILNFWENPIKFNANTFWFMPTIVELILKFDRGTDGIEYCKNQQIIGCVATSHLNPDSKVIFEKQYNIKLFESYGLSELLFVSTNYPNNDKPNSVGKKLNEVIINFKNDEILIHVPWMFLGYENSAENNLSLDGSYITGDLGKFLDDEFLFITGRKKDLIIKGGKNISPTTIENFVNSLKIFNEYVIIGIPDKFLGEKIVCFFNGKELSSNIKKTINQQIIKNLGRDCVIDDFFNLEHFPKTTSSKIDKPKLQDLYLKNQDGFN